ncbi:hypothetical protein BKP37_02380 [Anaerobacillus alkalilacustris]|uniref:Uncharacterized protein n=2 Tax=Anaerobacillus alkalilacustris TaxID=393763 RepID=A0A1S2LXZ2_9BACI|nr:hypothetical protein BKP37_02380 [Anaerobacillus alkalilacustris]
MKIQLLETELKREEAIYLELGQMKEKHNLKGITNKITEKENFIKSNELKLINYTEELINLQKFHTFVYDKVIGEGQIELRDSLQQMMNERV